MNYGISSFFRQFFEIDPNIGCYRLPTHRERIFFFHKNFFYYPFLFYNRNFGHTYTIVTCVNRNKFLIVIIPIVLVNPLLTSVLYMGRVLKFWFQVRKGSWKKLLWALRLWVGRQKQPIFGYVQKNDEKRIQQVN